MAFKDLDINEMVSLFSPFVNEQATKTLFLSIPEIAGLHPKVVAAHDMVVSVRPVEDVTDPEIAEISAKQRPLDQQHDQFARCSAWVLEARRARALAEDPPDEVTAAACGEVLAALLPEGTSITNASYRAEAGNVERVERLLADPANAAMKTLLKSIPVKKGENVLETVGLWIQAGTELGKLEAKKAARLAFLQGQAAPPQRVIQSARSQWIKVASLLVQALDVSDAPDHLKVAIVHPLLDAAERAGQRTLRRNAGKPESPAAPSPSPATPPTG
jgi:hypothetical protein